MLVLILILMPMFSDNWNACPMLMLMLTPMLMSVLVLVLMLCNVLLCCTVLHYAIFW